MGGKTLLAIGVLCAAQVGCAVHKERFCGYGLVEEDGGGYFFQRDGGGMFIERDGGGMFINRDGPGNPRHQVICRPGVLIDPEDPEASYNPEANVSVKGS